VTVKEWGKIAYLCDRYRNRVCGLGCCKRKNWTLNKPIDKRKNWRHIFLLDEQRFWRKTSTNATARTINHGQRKEGIEHWTYFLNATKTTIDKRKNLRHIFLLDEQRFWKKRKEVGQYCKYSTTNHYKRKNWIRLFRFVYRHGKAHNRLQEKGKEWNVAVDKAKPPFSVNISVLKNWKIT